jgi:hypothetical protein
MALDDWRDVINKDFPKVEVTSETIRNSVRMAERGYRSDVRVAVYTSKEFERYRTRVLNTPLP